MELTTDEPPRPISLTIKYNLLFITNWLGKNAFKTFVWTPISQQTTDFETGGWGKNKSLASIVESDAIGKTVEKSTLLSDVTLSKDIAEL